MTLKRGSVTYIAPEGGHGWVVLAASWFVYMLNGAVFFFQGTVVLVKFAKVEGMSCRGDSTLFSEEPGEPFYSTVLGHSRALNFCNFWLGIC